MELFFIRRKTLRCNYQPSGNIVQPNNLKELHNQFTSVLLSLIKDEKFHPQCKNLTEASTDSRYQLGCLPDCFTQVTVLVTSKSQANRLNHT